MTIPQYNNNEFSLYQLWHRLSGSRILFVVITFTKLHDLSTSGKSCKFNPVNLPEVHNKYSRWIRCSFFEEQEKLLVATSCRRVAVIWLHRQWCFHVSTPSGKAKHFDRLIVLFAKLKAKATKLTQKIHWLVTPHMLSTHPHTHSYAHTLTYLCTCMHTFTPAQLPRPTPTARCTYSPNLFLTSPRTMWPCSGDNTTIFQVLSDKWDIEVF